MNSFSVNLHNYYNNFENLHIVSLIDVSGFGTWMCKIEQFFYFALFDANAISLSKMHPKKEKSSYSHSFGVYGRALQLF